METLSVLKARTAIKVPVSIYPLRAGRAVSKVEGRLLKGTIVDGKKVVVRDWASHILV